MHLVFLFCSRVVHEDFVARDDGVVIDVERNESVQGVDGRNEVRKKRFAVVEVPRVKAAGVADGRNRVARHGEVVEALMLERVLRNLGTKLLVNETDAPVGPAYDATHYLTLVIADQNATFRQRI